MADTKSKLVNIPAAEVMQEYGGTLLQGLSSYQQVPEDLATVRSPAVISGTDFHQMLQVSLAPGDVITCEPGTMVMMSGDLQPTVDMGSCGQGFRRACCAGGNFFRLVFENKTTVPQFIGIAGKVPGRLIPLPLEKWSGVTLSKGAFVACYGRNWDYKIKLVGNAGTACCGGQGFFLPELTGTGTAFISASGAVEMLELQAGEKIVVDQANLVAFSRSVNFDVRYVGNLLTCCCGGMGMFNCVLTGPGMVIIESLPTSKLIRGLLLGAQQNGGGDAN